MIHMSVFKVRLFQTIRLEEGSRKLLLYNSNNSQIMSARLGVNMTHDVHPYKCLPDGHEGQDVKCFEWPDRATMTMTKEDSPQGVTCHRIVWTTLNKVVCRIISSS